MRFRFLTVLSVVCLGAFGTGALAQDASSDEQPDFIIKVPVKFDNLHKDITGSYVHCEAFSPEYTYGGDQATPARASSGDLGTDDFDGIVEMALSVRDYWDPDDTTEIVCEMSFNVQTDRGVERIDSELYGPTTAFGRDRSACRHEVEWLRAACTEKDSEALGLIRHKLNEPAAGEATDTTAATSE